MLKKIGLSTIVLFVIICTICILIYGTKIFTFFQQQYFQFINQNNFFINKGQVQELVLVSTVLKDDNRQVNVYLPFEYDLNLDKRYPVVYFLHGFPGNESDWLINGNLQNTLDEMIFKKEIPPMIFVFPNANGLFVEDSQYVDATKVDQNMGSFISKELVGYIDSKYRTLANRSSRIIGGSSSGGFGSLSIGLKNNDVFGIIISHSGYTNMDKLNADDLYQNLSDFSNDDPINLINKNPLNSETYVYFDIGSYDNASFIQDNNNLRDLLNKKGVTNTFKLTSGSHGWEVWRVNVKKSLKFIGNHVIY
ncbi:MAG: alpha/beta hydrolase-fold protein [bacterium]